MKLIIRNDDVSYFTQPRDLERWFAGIWDKYPIHLAVIPFVYGNSDAVPISKREEGYFSINENHKLMAYLKKKIKEGRVVIWQHGATHENYRKKPECVYSHDMGWAHTLLENMFSRKIKVFVAPHDRFSRKSIRMIEKLNMDICRAFAPRPSEWWDYSLYALVNLIATYLKYGKSRRYIHWLDCGNHRELYSYRLGEIEDEDIDDILKFHRGGTLCITVHHRSMNLVQLDRLNHIIREVEKNGKRR